jgi:hypothetical protein
MGDDDVGITGDVGEIVVHVPEVRHHDPPDHELRAPHGVHDFREDGLVRRIALRTDRPALETHGLYQRLVRTRDSEDGLVALRLEREAQPEVRIEVAERSKRRKDDAHRATEYVRTRRSANGALRKNCLICRENRWFSWYAVRLVRHAAVRVS